MEEKHCTLFIKGKRSKKERASVKELQGVVNALRSSEEIASSVSTFREELATLSPGQRWRFIDELPRICPGRVILRKRKGVEKRRYTGVAMLSVDNLASKDDVEGVKRAARDLPMTLLAVTGSSGRSVKILVRGRLTDDSMPRDEAQTAIFHTRLYNMACRAYAAILPSPITNTEASPDDTFRLTSDPDLFFDPKAAPFPISADDLHVEQPQDDSAAQTFATGSTVPESRDLWDRRFTQAVLQAYDILMPDGNPSHAPVDEERLLSLAAREAFVMRIPIEEAVTLAQHHHRWYQWDREHIRATVEGIYDELSHEEAPRDETSMQTLTYRLQAWMQERYDLRYNELANGVEWRANTSYGHRFQPLDSRVMNTMIQEANERGLEIFDRDMKRYLGSTRIRNYNEAQAYLSALPEWDGRTDHIKALADRVPTEDTCWADWFHTWFLGMVAQWLGWDRSHGNSVVPLLVGLQGCGKSTFGQLLLPPALREVGYKELVDFSTKLEVERMLTNSLLINLDEFNQIGAKTQQGFLKNLIQKSSVKGRRPYSQVIVNLPRYASFIATTNFGGVLADPSGSRRFIVVEVTKGRQIDTSTPVPYDAIYAQAMAELRAGRRYWFTPDDVRQLEEHNMSTEAQRPVVRQFLECFTPCTEEDDTTRRLRITEMLQEMRRATGRKPEANAEVFLGRWLQNERRKGRAHMVTGRGQHYYIVRNV